MASAYLATGPGPGPGPEPPPHHAGEPRGRPGSAAGAGDTAGEPYEAERSRPAQGLADRPVALITGASSGIGAAVAARFAADERGWRLLLHGRDRERLGRLAARTGGSAVSADLADPAAVRRLSRAVLQDDGHVDVLIASAGVGWSGPFVSMPHEAIDEVLSVDFAALVHLVRAVLPGMVERGGGQLVLIGSIAGAVGVRDEAVYSAAKSALGVFADSLRYELRGTGVHVCLVVPGIVDTPFFARRGTLRPTKVRAVSPARVADEVWRAVARGRRRQEIFIPRWLRLPARLYGAAPGLFRRLAGRFG
ncbi:SDR family NAD(P)-dependent oxidoreductase [Streptomyces sp. PR69]|uniref:SDR family NAD(P)-dependent oxidoreductase n=1 Tax=Streptomyces sp. PR69 TaxID=2984950 RepID=UPI002263D8B1|nr:SDR family NAD(P)-dependent oxidoreductase [Streptomyces sp. PR69]